MAVAEGRPCSGSAWQIFSPIGGLGMKTVWIILCVVLTKLEGVT